MNFANSHLVTPNGAQIKLYNNPANIVAKKFLPEGVVDYTYDAEYNLTRATNADSDLSFTYDPLSRLIQAQTAGSIQPATSISYGYDINNNLVSMTNPTGIVTNYVYDTLNRLTGITDSSDVYISSYTYDSLNRRVEKKLPNIAAPLTTSYTYDLASQLKSITNMPVNISNYYDNYDNVGNRLNMTDSTGTHNYTYDNLYRLTDSSNPSENYSYDPVGNRNPITQTYDAGNRLLENDTYTYTYDLDGNMTSKVKKVGGETTTYTYNSEDQLIGVVTPAQTVSYKYDALGRRIQKKIVDGSSEIVVKYVYDGEDIIQELDGNNALITSYTHGPGIDEPILVEKNSQKYYYISDGLGSITAIVDQNGNIAQSYRYDSFGNILSATGSLTQPYTYTGREYDTETGLYYYRARYYDPKIGRFLQEDPIWDDNLYSYCVNNPLNLIDPFGEKQYLFTSASFGGGIGYASGEIGFYTLTDVNTGENYSWFYISHGIGVGAGFKIGGAAQFEAGAFEYSCDPSKLPDWSWTISGFAAGIHGVAGQIISPTKSYTSISPSTKSSGAAGGYAIGVGAGISAMKTRSWYLGKAYSIWDLPRKGNK